PKRTSSSGASGMVGLERAMEASGCVGRLDRSRRAGSGSSMPEATALTPCLHLPARATVVRPRPLHPAANRSVVSGNARPSIGAATVPRTVPAIAVLALGLAACTGGDRVEPPLTPPGADETARTNALETGAALLQNNGPLAKMDVYVVGFHPMKDDPS